MKEKQRGDDHKLYCPTCKAGRNCMDHLMIRENDLQEQVTQLKADLATAKQVIIAKIEALPVDESGDETGHYAQGTVNERRRRWGGNGMKFQWAMMYLRYFLCGVGCWLLGTYAEAAVRGTRQIEPYQWILTSFFVCFFFVMAEVKRRKAD